MTAKLVKSSLRGDGTREPIFPADVHGRFHLRRRIAFALLIAVWLLLPLIRVRGNPAVFLDMQARKFYLFGATFNAQDIWLLFFVLTGIGFGLLYLTATAGRVWCGWACPQTVFLEGVFRPIERLIGGTRDERMRRLKGGWTWDRIWRSALIHGLYLIAAFAVAHMFLAYFVSFSQLTQIVRRSPAEHPEAFTWAMVLTGVFYFNFGWFREQLCLIICPYGRLQSALIDADSLVIGYDELRGEPRGKVNQEGAGDCIDCKRCVVVCPTSIDIRNGLQIDCIACTQCIDACDEIMDKIGRPRGLIRYDSLNGLAGKTRRFFRPRIFLYTALGCVGLVAATIAFRSRESFEANLLRLRGAPYTVEGDTIRNAFNVHLVNKRDEHVVYRVEPREQPPLQFVLPIREVSLAPLSDTNIPVFVLGPRASLNRDVEFEIRIAPKTSSASTTTGAGERMIRGKFLAPSR
jgi:cytochrome c oxidase accessory protein FixG